MWNTIHKGNRRMIDGQQVNIRRARFSWAQRKREVRQSQHESAVPVEHTAIVPSNRDHRSPRASASLSIQGTEWNAVRECNNAVLISSVEFSHQISESEVEWMDLYISVRVKEHYCVESISSDLALHGFKVLVCPMGGVSVLVKFSSLEEKQSFLKSSLSSKAHWLEDLLPLNKFGQRLFPLWIKLEEVPLYLWNFNFFNSLGDAWGTFLKMDVDTENKSRFDVANILVLVESKFHIPSVVNVKSREKVHKIFVTLEEDSLENCHCRGAVHPPVEAGKSLWTTVTTMQSDAWYHVPFDHATNEYASHLIESELIGDGFDRAYVNFDSRSPFGPYCNEFAPSINSYVGETG
ncbi:hypothetical protein PTKIN_Ptkin04bG0206600 [Pterospermum kingtungense]